jgi:hypothetical protein
MEKEDGTMADFIEITVVTTGQDLTDRFNVQQPLQVVFNRALQSVGGGSHRDQFTLEFDGVELDLDVKIGEAAAQHGWGDGVELELVPRPEVI